MVFSRSITADIVLALSEAPAVALLGPRQVGKTTLARHIAHSRGNGAVYLDLEEAQDRAKLADPAAYLSRHAGKLIVLDEIHRAPELFAPLRARIDAGRRLDPSGLGAGQFLILGSAALTLLTQSSESLAGRISFLEMRPFLPEEAVRLDDTSVDNVSSTIDTLWARGGFPRSYLAASDEASLRWRRSFLRTYLERDIPQFGIRVPAQTLDRFWTMLAHLQAGQWNAQQISASLGLPWHTVSGYLDLMVDLMLIRRLQPWTGNLSKRLVKSPKVYVRDSGLLHALLGIANMEALLSHPILGASWEGFVIEALIAAAPEGARISHFRTAAGLELDLVIEVPNGTIWAIEVKRHSAPKATHRMMQAAQDVGATRCLLVHSGPETWPGSHGFEVASVLDATRLISAN
jgi:hypothetical protein